MTSADVRVTSPGGELAAAVAGELGAALQPPAGELLGLLGLNNLLAVLWVVERQRAAGRLVLPPERVEEVVPRMRALGVTARRSRFDYRRGRSDEAATRPHEGGFVAAGDPEATDGVVVFGLEEDFLAASEEMELDGRDDLAGRLYGYPECCSDRFGRAGNGGLDRTATLAAGAGPHPRQMNPLVPSLWGVRILLHFPCSPVCAASRRLWEQRMSHLESTAPSIRRLRSLGRGIALYGAPVGSALVTGFDPLGEDRFAVREVTTTAETSRRLFGGLPACTVLRLEDGCRFRLGDVRYEDRALLAALFE